MKSNLKYFLAGLFCTLLVATAHSQSMGLLQTDSLKQALSAAKDDTTRVLVMANLGEGYRGSKPDSALIYAQQAFQLAQQIKFSRGEVLSLLAISVVYRELGNLPKALDFALKANKIAEEKNHAREQAFSLVRIGNVHIAARNFREALNNLNKAEEILKSVDEIFLMGATNSIQGDIYEQMDKLDSALYKQDLARQSYEGRDNQYLVGNVLRGLGNIYAKLGKSEIAAQYFHKAIDASLAQKDYRSVSLIYSNTAKFYKKINRTDSAIFYAKKGLEYAQLLSYKTYELNAASLLAELYEQSDPREAVKYFKIADAATDSLYSADKVQALQSLGFEEQQRQREIEAEKIAYANEVKQWALIAGLGVFLLIMLLLFRNNRRKQFANKLLSDQKMEIERTLDELKFTQSQLIQAEKMASLGELTAGIAHEIQNPLNFVNNFSEVNKELIAEMRQEIEIGNLVDATSIARNIADNEDKIVFHGKRADAIVKSMLQHSRTSSGQKELTDINLLADEYLRLSFHGLRAKEKTFNAKLETDFDGGIGKINIVPQDLGRVILNLINNAFYAVSEKKKQGTDNPADPGYEPTVTLTTRKANGKIEIKIRDNGNGIPPKVMDKIFQPFFTTKPTGQGTGLGLSLSYDIITKGHGGELKVETREGEGTEFIVQLPAG
jgi:two-component system, NtrC family, sensor kinase